MCLLICNLLLLYHTKTPVTGLLWLQCVANYAVVVLDVLVLVEDVVDVLVEVLVELDVVEVVLLVDVDEELVVQVNAVVSAVLKCWE